MLSVADLSCVRGDRTLFRGLRPIIEGSSVTPSLTVGYRNQLTQSVTYGNPIAINSYGMCPARVNARYHRARITLPASSTWLFARGVDDIQFSSMGTR